MLETENTKCGFVGFIGAPNAGKSTLMNYLVGTKVSIVSPKVQTTRSRVLGIAIHDQTQLVFIDTPGIFRPKKRLEKAMVAAAWQGAKDADILAVLVDSARSKVKQETWDIINDLKETGRKAILILNKIDLIAKDRLLALTEELFESGVFTDVYMISATKGSGVEKLMDDLAERMPKSPWMYAEDQVSDMPMRLLAAEVTREKLFLQLQEELPYACAVETEEWENFKNGDVRVRQVIYVERESQRAIILGHQGKRIKRIGLDARTELGEMLDTKVHLKIFVKVRKNWTDDPDRYKYWGLEFDVD